SQLGVGSSPVVLVGSLVTPVDWLELVVGAASSVVPPSVALVGPDPLVVGSLALPGAVGSPVAGLVTPPVLAESLSATPAAVLQPSALTPTIHPVARTFILIVKNLRSPTIREKQAHGRAPARLVWLLVVVG